MSSSTMPDELADGYNRFVSKRAEEQQNLYRELGQGQAPCQCGRGGREVVILGSPGVSTKAVWRLQPGPMDGPEC